MNKKILKQTLFAVLSVVFLYVIFAEAQQKPAKNKTNKQTTAKRIKYAPDADLLREMREQITVVESEQNWATLDDKTAVANPAKTMTAYVAQFKINASGTDGALIDVVVVEGKDSGEFFEIRGFDFPRPFENLKWISNDTLQFDQWVNPSRGGRYAVNLKTGRLVAAGYIEDK